MIDVTAASARASELRAALTDELVTAGWISSEPVIMAFGVVPRHLFAPEVTPEQAYAKSIVVTRRNEYGSTTSSVSAPDVQGFMLEQAELRPGMRVLEIGSGGYNAALIAEIVGATGAVTTIDIDPFVVDRARACLAVAGYPQVNVALADGEFGYQQGAPFDRIIVTAGAWDIPPAWLDQLAPGGTITVPLRMRGVTRSVTLARESGHLVVRSARVCGFVAMRGAGEHVERIVQLRGNEVGLRFDDGSPIDRESLNSALGTVRVEAWTGVTLNWMESFETLQLWLPTVLDGFCLLSVHPDLDTGLLSPQNKRACLAVVQGGSLGYLAVRPIGDTAVEFGAHAFGPDAAVLAECLADQIRAWDRDHRQGPGPRIAVYPAGTPDDQLPAGRIIDKRHSRVSISWAGSGSPAGDQAVLPHPQITE